MLNDKWHQVQVIVLNSNVGPNMSEGGRKSIALAKQLIYGDKMKSINDFTPEKRVVLVKNTGASGVVISNNLKNDPSKTFVVVEWDSGLVQKVGISELKLESDIENEFDKVRISVESKIKDAATALNLAIKEASDNGYSIQDFSTYELTDAMDHAGWNSSSMNC